MAKNKENEKQTRGDEVYDEQEFYDSPGCSRRFSVSKSYAYKLVRQLNDEMEALGYITVRGRVDANYFRKKVCYSE